MKSHALTPYAIIVLQKDNSVLLAKRQNTGFCDGFYSLIGGKVEPGETFRQAIIREVNEEVGLVINDEDLRFAHFFQRRGTDTEIAVVVFASHRWSGTPENKEPDKTSKLKWFDMNALPDNIIPAHKHALQLIASGMMYSEHNYSI